jgi:hypothetical protein
MRIRKVSLDEVGCCAMTHAFLRHPAHVREWGNANGRLHVLYEIFQNTHSLSFVPNAETAIAYRAFALAEVRRLRSGTNRLLCRHSTASHVVALQSLLVSLPAPAAN